MESCQKSRTDVATTEVETTVPLFCSRTDHRTPSDSLSSTEIGRAISINEKTLGPTLLAKAARDSRATPAHRSQFPRRERPYRAFSTHVPQKRAANVMNKVF